MNKKVVLHSFSYPKIHILKSTKKAKLSRPQHNIWIENAYDLIYIVPFLDER